jgi:predicted RNA-binding protein YlxR (DUF448 family)
LGKAGLVRFVLGPDGAIVPDIEERLPGRGFWLKAERGMVLAAQAGRHFAKAARAPVVVPADLADVVEDRLVRRCRDVIGLARRAGQVAVGFDRVAEALRRRPEGVLLAAHDGAPGGREKVRALAPAMPVIELLSRAELGQAVGRADAVHVLVGPGTLAATLLREAARLKGFRAAPGEGAGAHENSAEGMRNGTQ